MLPFNELGKKKKIIMSNALTFYSILMLFKYCWTYP